MQVPLSGGFGSELPDREENPETWVHHGRTCSQNPLWSRGAKVALTTTTGQPGGPEPELPSPRLAVPEPVPFLSHRRSATGSPPAVGRYLTKQAWNRLRLRGRRRWHLDRHLPPGPPEKRIACLILAPDLRPLSPEQQNSKLSFSNQAGGKNVTLKFESVPSGEHSRSQVSRQRRLLTRRCARSRSRCRSRSRSPSRRGRCRMVLSHRLSPFNCQQV